MPAIFCTTPEAMVVLPRPESSARRAGEAPPVRAPAEAATGESEGVVM